MTKDEVYYRMRDVIARCLQENDYKEPSYEDVADDIISALNNDGYLIISVDKGDGNNK